MVNVVISVIFCWLFFEYVWFFFCGLNWKVFMSCFFLCWYVLFFEWVLCSWVSRFMVLLLDRFGYMFILLGMYVMC